MKTVNVKYFGFECDFDNYQTLVKTNHEKLHSNTKEFNNMLGWVNLPNDIDESLLNQIEQIATQFKNKYDAVVFIGIGGSYLGLKMGEEFLKTSFDKSIIYYAGHNLSTKYLNMLMTELMDKEVALVAISKSGTTTEPAIAFRLLFDLLKSKHTDYKERVVVITDAEKGALLSLANKEGFQKLIIPNDVGGRYSVLTPVGLFGLAVAGANIKEIIRGAKAAYLDFNNTDISNNAAYQYAVLRNELYRMGKAVELMAVYEPNLQYFMEWWKQLYGESEGKNGKGLFPAAVTYTTDLHSLGQYVQSGLRILFETTLCFSNSQNSVYINSNEENLDNLNYLVNKSLFEINAKAMEATQVAHLKGDVPQIELTVSEWNEFSLGYLIYFFEKACAMSGLILGVNPFDQPGVEEYKTKMFELLKKPGY